MISGMIVVPSVLFLQDYHIRKVTNNELQLPEIKSWIYVLAVICGACIGEMYQSTIFSCFLCAITGYMFYMGFTDTYSGKLYNLSILAGVAGVGYVFFSGTNVMKLDLLSVAIYLLLVYGTWMVKGIAFGDVKLLVSVLPWLVMTWQQGNMMLIEILLGYLLISFFLELIFNIKKRKERVPFAGYAAAGFVVITLVAAI